MNILGTRARTGSRGPPEVPAKVDCTILRGVHVRIRAGLRRAFSAVVCPARRISFQAQERGLEGGCARARECSKPGGLEGRSRGVAVQVAVCARRESLTSRHSRRGLRLLGGGAAGVGDTALKVVHWREAGIRTTTDRLRRQTNGGNKVAAEVCRCTLSRGRDLADGPIGVHHGEGVHRRELVLARRGRREVVVTANW